MPLEAHRRDSVAHLSSYDYARDIRSVESVIFLDRTLTQV